MNRPIDYAGVVSGFIAVIEYFGVKDGVRYWRCRCVCGKEMVIHPSQLKRTKSCGCKNKGRHGLKHSHKRAYSSWQAMKARVKYKNRWSAKWYYEKGVSICDEWVNSFEKFLEDMGDPPDGRSIDRKDGALVYSKETCKWSSAIEQARNRSSTHLFLYQGNEVTGAELEKKSCVPRKTIELALESGEIDKYIPGAIVLQRGTKAKPGASP